MSFVQAAKSIFPHCFFFFWYMLSWSLCVHGKIFMKYILHLTVALSKIPVNFRLGFKFRHPSLAL